MVLTAHRATALWSGDVGSIFLRKEQGEWAALSLCFKTEHSTFGPGRAMVVIVDPEREKSRGSARFCITDNVRMARMLVGQIPTRFPEFQCASTLLQSLHFFDNAYFIAESFGPSSRIEKAVDYGRDVHVEMRWHNGQTRGGEITVCGRTLRDTGREDLATWRNGEAWVVYEG